MFLSDFLRFSFLSRARAISNTRILFDRTFWLRRTFSKSFCSRVIEMVMSELSLIFNWVVTHRYSFCWFNFENSWIAYIWLPVFIRISVVLVLFFWNFNCLNRKIRANKNKYPELSQRSISMMRDYKWRNNSKCHILCWNSSVHEINNTSHLGLKSNICVQRYCSSKYLSSYIMHILAMTYVWIRLVNTMPNISSAYFRDSSPRISLWNAKLEEKTKW